MDVVVLGAGAAGLGAGLTLQDGGVPFQILERDDAAGGLVRTDVVDGFSFERTGHVLHFGLPHVERRFLQAGVALERIERRAAVFVGDSEIPYPFQYNLWALGSRTLARGIVDDMKLASRNGAGPDSSFADRLVSLWGTRSVSLFFRPYNEKLWGRPLEQLPGDCAGGYLPEADAALAEQGAERRVDMPGYNSTFFYPSSGRLGDVMTALSAPIRDDVHCGVEVTAVELERRRVRTRDGELEYGTLVSTIPLAHLVAISGLQVSPPDLFAATEILNVRVGFRGRLKTPYHWTYIADLELPFHRIGFPKNVNRRTCPDGCASLSIEYTLPLGRRARGAGEIADTALAYLSRRGLIEVEERVLLAERLISPAYVVRRLPGRNGFAALERTLRQHGVLLAGRFGSWDYLSVEESFESGARAARACVAEAA